MTMRHMHKKLKKVTLKFIICVLIIIGTIYIHFGNFQEGSQQKVEKDNLKNGIKSNYVGEKNHSKYGRAMEEQKEFKKELEHEGVQVFNGKQNWALEEEEITKPHGIDLELIENRIFELKLRVENACDRLLKPEELRNPINSWEFVISHKYHLIYCPIFKAASSSWLYNFLLMNNVSIEKIKSAQSSPVEFARKFYKRPKEEYLKTLLKDPNYKSFMIVREPFQRLLSAYRDKIESFSQEYYHSLRCKISQYGPKYNSRACEPNFAQFVSYVITQNKAGKKPNEHWAPYVQFCSPCQAHFDFILKFESLSEEEVFLIDQVSDLGNVVKPHKLHSSHTDYEHVLTEYYSNITIHQLEALIDIYRKDFDIFDYNYSKYIDMVKK